jgi:hypothetical protein
LIAELKTYAHDREEDAYQTFYDAGTVAELHA